MIIFKSDINDSFLRFVINKSVLEFYTDSPFDALRATLTFSSSDQPKFVFKSPDNSFYYDLTEWFTELASIDGYTDTLNTDIEASGSFYDWTQRTCLKGNLEIKIEFSNSNTVEITNKELTFINGVIQLEDFKKRFPLQLPKENLIVLNPLTVSSNYTTYAKYWDGYPMDFCVYSEGSFVISNAQNNQTISHTPSGSVTRCFVSDGITDIGINEVLNLIYGTNRLSISKENGATFEILLNKNEGCRDDGHYVKWINSLGGYSYWLFERGQRDRTSKDEGDVNNDFYNAEDTISQTLQLGKTSNDTISVVALGVDEIENNLLSDLFDSPAVFLFIGERFDSNKANDWMGVKIKGTSTRIKNYKKDNVNFSAQIELPERYTRKK